MFQDEIHITTLIIKSRGGGDKFKDIEVSYSNGRKEVMQLEYNDKEQWKYPNSLGFVIWMKFTIKSVHNQGAKHYGIADVRIYYKELKGYLCIFIYPPEFITVVLHLRGVNPVDLV